MWSRVVPVVVILSLIMYQVVEFDDGSLAIILDKWYTPEKQNMYWPPLQEYCRAVRNLSGVSSDWDKFSIERKFYETENFETAQSKLKLAEEFSDINKGDDTYHTRRRQVKKPKHLVIESSDDEEPEIHERPPKCFIKKIPGKTVKRPIEELSAHSQMSSCSQTLVSSNDKKSFGWNQKSQSPVSWSLGSGNTCSTSNEALQKRLSQSKSTIADDLFVNNADQSVQRKILENLVFIKEQNKEILNFLKSGLIGTDNRNHVTYTFFGLPELPIDLPCTSTNDVIKLEEYLSLKENFSALVIKMRQGVVENFTELIFLLKLVPPIIRWEGYFIMYESYSEANFNKFRILFIQFLWL
ncbi:uncharacterized protein isoform X2 [Leptinotarsa decemlineata]|uniref:uncharacterized protein isoform X2 n=1 Tax=Leptinotarsa decemlineata TaxID=7539 RepID=UPI003D309246